MKYLYFLKKHKLALFVAAVIGIICIAPQIIFQISLGSGYKGIYLMQTANELDYLGRIQEIKDGHFTLSSVSFLEYKDKPALMPPNILEILVAVISFVWGVSVSSIVILSKFFLPAFLFFLIYFFVHRLAENQESLANKINAIGAGMLIVLGYDLVDYRSIFKYLSGITSPNDFLLWTRPFNPILGGLLIFSFLLIVWRLYQKSEKRFASFVQITLAGIILALAINSYFFTWGMILSLIGALFFFGLLKARYDFIKNLIFTGLIGLILSLPYFYNIFIASRSVFYQESASRFGFFLTHQPVLNQFLLFSLLIFLSLSFLYKYVFLKDKKIKFFETDWWIFSLAMILAGFIAFNQQIITGRTVWYYHFVQYTIPLSITALFIVFYNIAAAIGKKISYIWSATMIFIILISLLFGIYTQASTYKQSYSFYKENQKYADIFSWLNRNVPKDCVILTENYGGFLNRGILAFTHCNNYLASPAGSLVPFDRLYYSYLVSLRLKGIKSGEIADYLKEKKHGEEAAIYLYGDEGLSHGASSPSFVASKNKLVSDYEEFLKNDLKSELMHYKLDYIITTGGFSDEMKNLLEGFGLVYSPGDYKIYKFK